MLDMVDPSMQRRFRQSGDQTVEPSGVPGEGSDLAVMPPDPPGFGHLQARGHRQAQQFDLNGLAAGTARDIQMDWEPDVWLISIDASMALSVWLTLGTGGEPIRVFASRSICIPGRGQYLSVRNDSVGALKGTVLALKGWPGQYSFSL